MWQLLKNTIPYDYKLTNFRLLFIKSHLISPILFLNYLINLPQTDALVTMSILTNRLMHSVVGLYQIPLHIFFFCSWLIGMLLVPEACVVVTRFFVSLKMFIHFMIRKVVQIFSHSQLFPSNTNWLSVWCKGKN